MNITNNVPVIPVSSVPPPAPVVVPPYPPVPEACPVEGTLIDLDIPSAESSNTYMGRHADDISDLSVHADMSSSQASEMEVDQHLSTSQLSSASHEHDDDNDTIMGEIVCPPTGPIIQPTEVPKMNEPTLTNHLESGPTSESGSGQGIFHGPDVMRGPSVEIVNLVDASI